MNQPAVIQSTLVHLRTPLYRNAYAMMASNLLTSALGVVYWGLAARLYSVDEVGLSSAVISTMLFLTGVAQLNLRAALVRLVPEAGEGVTRLVWISYGVSLGATAVLASAVFGAMALTGRGVLGFSGLASLSGVVLLVLGTLAWTLFNLQDGVLIGLRRTVWLPLENGLFGVAKIVMLVALVLTAPALGILVSWIVPMVGAVVVVTAVLAWRWLPVHARANRSRSMELGRDRVLRYAAADYGGSLFALAVTALLPVLIVTIADTRAGGTFYVVWLIATSLNLLPNNMCASMTVEAIHSGADLAQETRRVAIHMARLLVPLVIGVVLLADWITRIFGPEYVAGGTTPLRIVTIAVLPAAVNTLYLATCRIRAQGGEIVRVQAAITVLTLGGAVVALPAAGITGVAVAWLLAQLIVAIYAARALRTLIGSEPETARTRLESA